MYGGHFLLSQGVILEEAGSGRLVMCRDDGAGVFRNEVGN